jgi:hypothetical protein
MVSGFLGKSAEEYHGAGDMTTLFCFDLLILLMDSVTKRFRSRFAPRYPPTSGPGGLPMNRGMRYKDQDLYLPIAPGPSASSARTPAQDFCVSQRVAALIRKRVDQEQAPWILASPTNIA